MAHSRQQYNYRYLHHNTRNHEDPYGSFPRFPSRGWGSSIWLFTVLFMGLFFLVAVASAGINLYFTIKFVATDNTGFEYENPDFPLFKNSRFEECSARTPDPANCTAITEMIRSSTSSLDQEYQNRGFIPVSQPGFAHNGISYDWCTAASCFQGYKVVPSTNRPAIIGLTNFGVWSNMNMAAVLFLFIFMKRNWALHKNEGDRRCGCSNSGKGAMDLFDWIVVLYTAGSNIVWWWVNFGTFLGDPVPNSEVSIYGWANVWLLASNMHYHPYACSLRKSETFRKFLSWVFGLLAAAQWVATIHVLNVGWRDALQRGNIYQGYDCVQTRVSEAPGTSQCTTEELCSDAAFLGHMPFYWAFMEQIIIWATMAFFGILSAIALQPFVWATWRSISSKADNGTWAGNFKRCDIGPIAGPAVAGIFAAGFCGIASHVAILLLNSVNREAPLVVNPDCTAVHVGLSSWRYYLDLEDLGPYARALRIARSWFNA